MAKKLVSEADFEEPAQTVTEKAVNYGDPEWHDYVLGQLTDGEKENGLPKCDGLRRVFFKLFDVIESRRDLFDRNPTNPNSVTVGWTAKFLARKSFTFDPASPVLPTITVTALASATSENTKYPFSNYLEAVADTRAEARCYKKALLLRCLTAEETAENLAQTENQPASGQMTEAQKKAITAMCKRININLKGTLRHHAKEISEQADPQFEKLTADEASKFMTILNSYQCNSGRVVPTEIKDKEE